MADLGYPVALKMSPRTLSTNLTYGGVKLNLADTDDTRQAYGEILASVARANPGP